MPTNRPNPIARQNDLFRSRPAGGLMLTAGVRDKGATFVQQTLYAIRTFNAFTDANDPYGEHDFGAVTVDGERLFWKIDYYDLQLEYSSPDPCDPAVTRRILTIMLAEDY